MATHFLKTINPFFQQLWDGKKTFEIRFNDRNYQIDDVLVLQEYYSEERLFTGREIKVKVPYILSECIYLPYKYVCMSIHETCRVNI